ncbi:sigma-70 family RNA polymerase sigma factor [Arenimonas terrae]|uniref:Sigma-70 family RNA polymerase sigma factor n=1 Tax=Arenimonas terrae TaxID=2546226 RepID=A0A5C4RQH8_9GAMM|nr:sigma-70 family RNA polymerase sigma factor [Arenimonas terrae]TNJ33224.1 sigma-70 family RNA polymerase sigma factor [Arenimonas terrae]
MKGVESGEVQLWERYRRRDDRSARDQIFEAHSGWAAAIGAGLHRQYWSPQAERDDYLQNARVGLLEAMSRYDPDRGVPFRVFAQSRVRGAVLNALRVAQDSTQLPAASAETADSRARPIPADAFETLVASIVSTSLGFLLESAIGGEADADDGFVYARNRQIETRIRAAVNLLPARHQEIIVEHYFRQTPLHDMADRWRLTKGRVSQLHHDALIKLRATLRDLR